MTKKQRQSIPCWGVFSDRYTLDYVAYSLYEAQEHRHELIRDYGCPAKYMAFKDEEHLNAYCDLQGIEH